MAVFPSIEPLDRSYDLGAHPIAAATFNNGDETRFLHGSLATGVPLTLEFRGLTLTKARQISGHWADHGLTKLFMIPPHLWRTHASQSDVVPAGFLWRWAAPPEETPRNGGLFEVRVALLSVG